MALTKKQKEERARKQIAAAQADLAALGIVDEVTAPAIAGPKMTNTSTVWVGCKLPRGLFLRLVSEVTIDRPTFGGGVKPVKMYMPDPKAGTVRLKGYAIPFGMVPNYPIIGDFGLTEVDRTWWETWKSQNKGFDMLEKGLIFEHGEKASVEAYAEEHAKLLCGLEPMNPEGDPRQETVDSENLTEIEADNERTTKRKAVA